MHLNDYILSANRLLDSVAIVHHEHKQFEQDEDGVTVFYQQDVYQFADQTQLRCEREIDDIEGVLDETVCQECWITYVLQDATGLVLGKKTFTSFCQERFWLNRQYHQINDDFQ